MDNGYSGNGHNKSKIKTNIIIAIRLTFSMMMFAVFAYMPCTAPTVCGFVLGGFGTYTQGMPLVETMLVDEKRTTITLKDVLSETEQVVECAIGEVLDIDIPTKENYTFNGYWTEIPKNAMPNREWGEQYIDRQGKGIKPITEETPNILYVNWVGVECNVKFYIGSSCKVTQTAYFGNTFGDCFEFPTNEELNLTNEICFWYRERQEILDEGDNVIDIKFLGDIQTKSNVIDTINSKRTLKLYGKVVNLNEKRTYTVTLEIDDDAEFVKLGTPIDDNWCYDGNKCTQQYTYIKDTYQERIGKCPSASKKGYWFSGWENVTTEKEIDVFTEVTKNMRCIPIWEIMEVTVKFSDNGNDGEDTKIKYGEKLNIDNSKLPRAKEHYTFLGYYSESGEQYIDSQGNGIREWDIECDKDKNVTLLAKFEPIEYTIAYDLSGGTQAETNPQQYNIESETITLTAPTKAGYNFVGWITAENKTPQKEITIPQGAYGNRTYIAVYELNTAEQLKITITCTNYSGQTIFVYIYDEQQKLITSIPMTTAQFTHIPENNGEEYYLQFKMPIPNKLTFTNLPNNCKSKTLDSTTTIAVPTPKSQNYEINFTATNIQITNTIII